MTFYDALETRSADARAASLAECLPALLTHAQSLAGYGHFAQFDLASIATAEDLARLPVLRKSELGAAQKCLPPFGGFSGGEFDYAFQSPGPLYEPGRNSHDWWRFARFCMPPALGQAILCKIAFPII